MADAHTASHKSYDIFASNSVYRNAVCLCLLQIGELVNYLSEDFKSTYPQIPWQAIRGMRNVVAHEYGKIDTATVWETAENGVQELQEFCRQVLG
nr:HepT-like ribonuclease domain-containing protein [Acutalibacter muris]